MPTPQITATVKVPLATWDDMRRSLEWWQSLLPDTAREELAFEQARGNLKKPTTLVDKRKSNDLDAVKPFGMIQFVDRLGPVGAAVTMADAIAHSAAPQDTGHYARSFRWLVNGKFVDGPPTSEEVGVAGNAMLVDLAPYAAMAEIFVPRGVIYAAYNQLVRAFGSTLAIRFNYGKAADFGGHREKPGTKGGRYFAVPILTIGNPTSTVTPGRKAPGVNIRERRSQARRALRKYVRGA